MVAKNDQFESNQLYRLLFDKCSHAILLIRDFTIIECNERAVELLQISREKLLGKSFGSLHEAFYSSEGDHLVHALSQSNHVNLDKTDPLEWVFVRKDNQRFETDVFINNIEINNGIINVLNIHPVPLRYQKERRLWAGDSIWQALFRHAPFGIAINRLEDGVYLDINPALENFSNRTRKEMIGSSVNEFLTLNQVEQSQAVAKTLKEKGYSGLQEAEVKRQDGTTGYVFYSAATFDSGDETNIVSMVVDITERKEIEKQLLESEAKLKSLFSTVPVGIAIIKDRIFLAANERLSEITGYPTDEILGNTSRFLYFSEEEFLAVGKALYDHLLTDNKKYVETRFRHKDGSSRYISLFSAPLDLKNLNAGFSVAIQDITEEKATLQALQESDKRYRSLFDAAGDAIMINKDGLLIDCNQRTLDIFDCKRNEIIGKSPAEISPMFQADGSESAMQTRHLLAQALAGNVPNFEWTHLRPDGTTFETEVTLSAVELSGDKVIQAIVRDISERKKSEKILRENEFRFRSFFHTNPEGIMLIDFQGRILDANKAFLKRSGYSLNDFHMDSFNTLMPDEQQEHVMQSLLNLKRGIRPPDSIQTIYISKSGELVPVSLKSWVVMDESSNPLYLGVFIHDLTKEMKLAEEKISLEKQVIRAQKSEAIGTLASGIAHDFNNILSGIIGFTELALYRDPNSLDEKTREFLNRVLEGGNRAKGLVQQILRFSRNSDTVMESVSLFSILKETLLLLQATIPSTITIEKQFAAEEDKILGDPNQIHQVIMNLATNAYHAMKDEGGILTIKMDNTTLEEAKHFMSMTIPAGEYVRITLADTGCGMPPAVLERLFEPYFTTKNVNEGTGLGMAVVSGIVKSHRGLIAVETAPGKGTVFEVYFPITRVDAVQEAQTQPITSFGNGQKILIVDDEAYFLDVVEENLRNLGYQVTSCRSSMQAFQIFSESPAAFDLLVTDQTMPEITGVQLIQKIQKIRDHFPVILCTGFSEAVTEQSSEYYGINRFLMKPVSVNDLAEAVYDVLSEGQDEVD